MANARKVRAISQSLTKSYEHDARMLARLCRADPALLSPVKHRSEKCQRDLVQLKAREALVRARGDLMNSTRFLLKSPGLTVPTQRFQRMRSSLNQEDCTQDFFERVPDAEDRNHAPSAMSWIGANNFRRSS